MNRASLITTIILMLMFVGEIVPSHFVAAQETSSLTPKKVNPRLAELGKRIFYDQRISGDTSLSCASCHNPEKAFTDGLSLSDAYTGSKHFRNTPTLANVGFRQAWMHDGRLGTNLNDVAREMITETYLMNMDMRIMQERMKQDPIYINMFKSANLGEPSNGGARKALEAFMQTIVSRNAPFDQDRLSDAAKRGMAIFNGKGGCSSCHSGNRFTDDNTHNTSVPDNPDIWNDPTRHSAFVTYAKFMGIEKYMSIRQDLGAYIRNHKSENKRQFLTPTLRELVWTAPYMHNGMIDSLEEVVEFYNNGGGNDPLKDKRIKTLNLNSKEKSDLVEFLKSLSGENFNSEEYVWTKDDYDYSLIQNWRNTKN